MDKKRKSGPFYDGKSQGKRLKPQHDEPDINSTQVLLGDHKYKSLVSDFPSLAHEVLNSLQGVENGSIIINSDITSAAMELSKALSAASHRGNGQMDGNAHDSGSDIPIPTLPPILDKNLERAVLTHPAMSNDIHATYDRLEVLGDAYLELIATRLIWNRCGSLSSGRISQIREQLVNNETLAGYASRYGLDKKASVPRDSLMQPKRWTKIKGDIFEAYVAAVILSDPISGYSKAEKWLSYLWQPTLSSADLEQPVLQAKEDLAKRIMGKGIRLRYVEEQPCVQHGKGRQTFFIGVYLSGWGWDNMHLGSGQGPNKAIAGNEAALRALKNGALITEISMARQAGDNATVKE